MFGWKNRFSDLTVIRPDGGICSQIGFVALGETIRQGGGRVKYDLGWYRECGKDNDGRFVRNWDFQTAFPSIPIEIASKQEIDYLSCHRAWHGGALPHGRDGLFVQGYPEERITSLVNRIAELRVAFAPLLSVDDMTFLEMVSRERVCAVHVRRGDLSQGNDWYGRPASASYFHRAMKVVTAVCPVTRFVFFSDEPAWVRDHLLPELPHTVACEIMSGNGSDRGYADLYLISRCAAVIASAGTLGIFGALLAKMSPLLVMNRKWDYVLDNFENVILVKDGFPE